jgi:hypothetical protein
LRAIQSALQLSNLFDALFVFHPLEARDDAEEEGLWSFEGSAEEEATIQVRCFRLCGKTKLTFVDSIP